MQRCAFVLSLNPSTTAATGDDASSTRDRQTDRQTNGRTDGLYSRERRTSRGLGLALDVAAIMPHNLLIPTPLAGHQYCVLSVGRSVGRRRRKPGVR